MKWRSAMFAWLAVVILSAPLLAQPGATPARAQAGPSLAGPVTSTEPLPPGVSVQTLLTGMDGPVAMAFDPSGRLFYTQKNGTVRLFANGKLQDAPVIRFSVDTSGERGLLGIA